MQKKPLRQTQLSTLKDMKRHRTVGSHHYIPNKFVAMENAIFKLKKKIAEFHATALDAAFELDIECSDMKTSRCRSRARAWRASLRDISFEKAGTHNKLMRTMRKEMQEQSRKKQKHIHKQKHKPKRFPPSSPIREQIELERISEKWDRDNAIRNRIKAVEQIYGADDIAPIYDFS